MIVRGTKSAEQVTSLVSLFSKAESTFETIQSTGPTSEFAQSKQIFVSLLRQCIDSTDLQQGKSLHSLFSKHKLDQDPVLSKLLIELYQKCGSAYDSFDLFAGIDRSDPVLWNSLISSQSRLGCHYRSLQLYVQMMVEGIYPTKVTFVCIIPVCTKIKSLDCGKRLHCQILHREFASDIVVTTAILNMYGRCGSLDHAYSVFNHMPTRDVVSWNAMITMYAQHGKSEEAIQVFVRMQLDQIVPDPVTLVNVLNACAHNGIAGDGMLIHYLVIESMEVVDVAIYSALVHMYGKCDAFNDAWTVFSQMSDQNVVSFNTMIGLCRERSQQKVIELFQEMLSKAILPDKVSFITFMDSSTYLRYGLQMHACLLKGAFEIDVTVWNALVTMYGVCGNPEKAREVFDRISERNVVSWNAMMAVYIQHGQGVKALQLYEKMLQAKVIPNKVTYMTILAACNCWALLHEGKRLHAHMHEKFLIGSDFSLGTALVNMYGKCGRVKDAKGIFDTFIQRDVVLWSAIITAYAQNDAGGEALRLVGQMQQEGNLPDRVTYVSILDACASHAAMTEGKNIHRRILDSGLESDVIVGTALVNMYGKCGNVKQAREMFDKMPTRSAVSWNAMLSIYSMQGHGKQVLLLFREMKEKAIVPDKSTFISVLTACCHCGLLNDGRKYFRSMQEDYGLSPAIDHYVCMIDLFGRTGHLDEAEKYLQAMPMQPTIAPLMAFLGGCRYKLDVKRGEQIAGHVFELDPTNPAPYVMLFNIYSAAGKVREAEELMNRMRSKGIRRKLGYSYIEVKGKVHKFVTNDQVHPRKEDIYLELQNLAKMMEGVNKDQKMQEWYECEEPYPCYHSEKLAVAYGLLEMPIGTAIFVTKNLKICGDCHFNLKFITRLTNRTIILRDANCLHHMTNGVCSCADYW